MFIGHVGTVAGSINAGDGGSAAGIYLYLALRIEWQNFAEDIGVGRQTYLNEDAIEGYVAFFVVGAILHSQTGDAFSVAQYLRGLRRKEDVDVLHCGRFLLQNGVSTKRVGQIDSGLDARVASADNGDTFSTVERTVAMRTEVNAAAQMFRLTLDVKPAPAGSSSHNHSGSTEHFAAGYGNTLAG